MHTQTHIHTHTYIHTYIHAYKCIHAYISLNNVFIAFAIYCKMQRYVILTDVCYKSARIYQNTSHVNECVYKHKYLTKKMSTSTLNKITASVQYLSFVPDILHANIRDQPQYM